MPFALGVSVVLHGVMLQFVPGFIHESADIVRPVPLTVELTPAAEWVPETVRAVPTASTSLFGDVPAPIENLFTAASIVASTPERTDSADGGRSYGAQYRVELPAPSAVAPRYYGSREIDVFPEPIVPLRMTQSAARAATVAGQRVRMEVFIDAQGVVTDVAVRESGDSSQTLAAARKLILAARFHPARRSGNAVASRIEIELHEGGDPHPAAAESR